LLLEDFDLQVSNTRRTLQQVSAEKAHWALHVTSMNMGKLAMHGATMPLFGSSILEDDGMDVANSNHPQASLVFESRQLCLSRLDQSAANCRTGLAAASDEALAKLWKCSFGERM
jgi:hypothetical protein